MRERQGNFVESGEQAFTPKSIHGKGEMIACRGSHRHVLQVHGDAVLAVRVQVPDRVHVGWLPHLTLARRLDRAQAQRAVDALGHEDVLLTFTELRRWDPDLGAVTRVAGDRFS